MPDPFRITIIPRYYECDPDGLLRTVQYIRMAIQAPIEAGAAADLLAPGLEAAGWLEHVGEIGLQIRQPVAFGDAVDMETRLTRVGPPVWRRQTVFERAGQVLAVAFVDVFDGSENEGSADDASDELANGSAAWDEPVGEPPEPPGRAFRAVWRASWQHLDISGQLDPAWLTHTLADMESRAAESVGWSAAREQEQGIAWRATEHRLELFEPIQSGDVLNITSYIGEVGDDEMVRHALIERQENGVNLAVARGRTRWVCLSTETTERCLIPDDWIEDLTDQMAEL